MKNCPFCGGEAGVGTVRYQDRMVKQQKWGQDTFYFVACTLCGASNIGLVGHRSPEDATARWNRRTSTPTDQSTQTNGGK
jgi:Lar family restriction alleviation protein